MSTPLLPCMTCEGTGIEYSEVQPWAVEALGCPDCRGTGDHALSLQSGDRFEMLGTLVEVVACSVLPDGLTLTVAPADVA